MVIASKLKFQLAAMLFATACAGAAARAQATPPPVTTTPATVPDLPSAPQAPTSSQAPQSQQPQLPDAPGAAAPAHVDIEATGPTVIFDTTSGRMSCKLFDKQSPLASANFIGLATGTKEWTDPTTGQKVRGRSFYNGTTFHRVIPGFMIQGGDRKGDGSGDAGYYFNNENTDGLLFDVPGRLAMANAGPNTNGTQFFITEVAYPDLNGKYTIFGQCDAHTILMVASIARVERDSADKPLSPITLTRVTIVQPGEQPPPAPAVAPAAAPVPALPVAPMPGPR